jgi:predicted O-linked N-acetylglucosamine transferase (SPINDLY family)
MLASLLRSLRSGRAAKVHAEAIDRWRRNDVAGAEASFRRALALNPGLMPAWSNLGQVLWEQGRARDALACLAQAVEIDPASAVARLNLGVALMNVNRAADAVAQFREAIRLDPSLAHARATLVKPLRDLCEWDDADAHTAALVDLWRRDPRVAGAVPPFLSLLLAVGPEFRLAVARAGAQAVSAKVRELPRPPRAADTARRRRRIGYVSADLHAHAVALTSVRLFELHDRERFETFAYSFDAGGDTPIRRRLEGAFDHFADVRGEAFPATAARIAGDGIDVLVDLMGYTAAARPELFALRPAPVQIAFLGFAGTTGADYMDGIVADGFVVPPGDERWYAERVLRLPTTYFPVDDRRTRARPARRDAFGLPEEAVVYCSFGEHAKIERDVFAAWLRILGEVPGSLLWLSSGAGEARLRRTAAERGIDPARLRFASRLPDEADYLGRLQLADLFLDTRTYNAHSTAVDALWAGVPLLTVPGDGFAGRVGASLLHAVRLPELVAADPADYEARAIALGRHPERLRALRAGLDRERTSLPLFDSARFARELESVLWSAVERGKARDAP